MDRETKREAIRLANEGYTSVWEQLVVSFAAPLFWYDEQAPLEQGLLGNGTVFFVELPKRLIGVTADHVVEECLSKQEGNSDVTSAIFAKPFPLRERMIARDSKLDVATFAIEREELESFGNKWAHRPSYDWPPPPPQVDRGVLFTGFPKVLREERGIELVWSTYTGLQIAQVVEDDRILVQYEREYFIDPLGRGIPPEGLWIGGMSGCPLFALWEKPIEHLRLAGVGIEFDESLELCRFRPIQCIQADGTIVSNA